MSSLVIVEDWQQDLRSLLMGSNTAYGVARDDCLNWWDLAEIRASDVMLPGRDGVLAGDDLYGGTTLTWSIDIAPPTTADLQAHIDALKAAFARSDVDLPMYATMAGTQRLRWVRPRRCAINTARVSFGWARAVVQVLVVDPLSYGPDEHTMSATLVVTDLGLMFPATFPVTFGAVGGGAGTFAATNDGNAPAPWTATITGPITDPVITNVTTGVALTLSGELLTGEYLTLNSKTRTILRNGTTNASHMRAAGAQWFFLEPGTNSISFSAGGEPPYGELTMTWRSAWL